MQIGRCLSQSWKLLTGNFGLLFGATSLVWLITVICHSFLGIVYLVLYGVLYGGLCLVTCRPRMRGLPVSVGDVSPALAWGSCNCCWPLVTVLLTFIGTCCW